MDGGGKSCCIDGSSILHLLVRSRYKVRSYGRTFVVLVSLSGVVFANKNQLCIVKVNGVIYAKRITGKSSERLTAAA